MQSLGWIILEDESFLIIHVEVLVGGFWLGVLVCFHKVFTKFLLVLQNYVFFFECLALIEGLSRISFFLGGAMGGLNGVVDPWSVEDW